MDAGMLFRKSVTPDFLDPLECNNILVDFLRQGSKSYGQVVPETGGRLVLFNGTGRCRCGKVWGSVHSQVPVIRWAAAHIECAEWCG